jgi:hypothetical protein
VENIRSNSFLTASVALFILKLSPVDTFVCVLGKLYYSVVTTERKTEFGAGGIADHATEVSTSVWLQVGAVALVCNFPFDINVLLSYLVY